LNFFKVPPDDGAGRPVPDNGPRHDLLVSLAASFKLHTWEATCIEKLGLATTLTTGSLLNTSEAKKDTIRNTNNMITTTLLSMKTSPVSWFYFSSPSPTPYSFRCSKIPKPLLPLLEPRFRIAQIWLRKPPALKVARAGWHDKMLADEGAG
jgi:hypothetical protein